MAAAGRSGGVAGGAAPQQRKHKRCNPEGGGGRLGPVAAAAATSRGGWQGEEERGAMEPLRVRGARPSRDEGRWDNPWDDDLGPWDGPFGSRGDLRDRAPGPPDGPLGSWDELSGSRGNLRDGPSGPLDGPLGPWSEPLGARANSRSPPLAPSGRHLGPWADSWDELPGPREDPRDRPTRPRVDSWDGPLGLWDASTGPRNGSFRPRDEPSGPRGDALDRAGGPWNGPQRESWDASPRDPKAGSPEAWDGCSASERTFSSFQGPLPMSCKSRRDSPERESGWGGPPLLLSQPGKPQPLLQFKRKTRWDSPGRAKEETPLPSTKQQALPRSLSPPRKKPPGLASLEKMRKLLEPLANLGSWSNVERAARQGSPLEWSHSRQDPHPASPSRLGSGQARPEKGGQLPPRGTAQGEGSWWHESPQLGEGPAPPGSYASHNQVAWERGAAILDGSPEVSQRGHLDLPQGKTSKRTMWHPVLERAWQGSESARCAREGGPPDEDGLEGDAGSPEGKQGGWQSPSASETSSTPFVTPKRWTPCEQVLKYWSTCQKALQGKTKDRFVAVCPRPTLPDRTAETPRLNADIAKMLSSLQVRTLSGATRALNLLQREVLDMLGPAMTICEMAQEALEKQEPVDAMELREWSHRILRYIGSLNCQLNAQRRTYVLGAINPRLKSLSSKVAGGDTHGMLFAEDKVQLLKEIIKRFPQLRQARHVQQAVPARMLQKRTRAGRGAQHRYGAAESCRRNKANQRADQEHF